MNSRLRKPRFGEYAMVLVVVVLFNRPSVVRAQEVAILDFDPSQTQIRFTLGSFPHSVEGTFKLKRGRVRLNMRTSTAEGAVVADATSGETGNSWRDGGMRRDIL